MSDRGFVGWIRRRLLRRAPRDEGGGTGAPPSHLELVAVGPVGRGAEVLRWLEETLGERLGIPVHPGEPLPLRDAWRDVRRGQICSNSIVDALIDREPERGEVLPARWVLGVTEADLYAPGRDYVFGEATMAGAWALISLARLWPDGDAADPGVLLRRRALKEAVHELGHLAGLSHCLRPECVMFASVGIGETDRKSSSLCPACRSSASGSVLA